MKLTYKKICHEFNTVEPVERLIQSAFPPDEQEPMEVLLEMAKKPMVNFWAYYDGDMFCGMTYVVESKDVLFVLYLAVPGELRSKGYGAAIIEDVRNRFGGRDMVLHVEDPNEDAAKAEQRIRRIKFYEKLGFTDTGYRINGDETTFYLISTAKDYRISTYMELMRDYSYGKYTPKVYKVEE